MRTWCVLVAGVFALTSAPLFAGNTWTGGGGGSFLWSNNANWGGAQPAYGTITFAGATGTTNIMDQSYSMNQLNVTSAGPWTLNNSNSAVLSLFDNSGVQAKVENNGSGTLTLNLPITFAATVGPNFGEINAVSGNMTFGTGTLTVNGSQIADIRLYGTGRVLTFNNTVSASGRDFGIATNSTGNTVNIGGSFTADNFSVMNGGILNLNAGGNLNSTGIRLGADYVGSGNINNTLGATLNLAVTTGGQTIAGVINTGSNASPGGNTSNALAVNSNNTSGTNTISGNIFLDSDLAITQASGGILNITNATLDLKNQTLSLRGSGGNINITGVIGNSTGNGQLVVGVNGAASTPTVTLSNTNTYTGETFVRAGTLAFTSAGSSNNSTIRLGSTSGTSVNANVNFSTLAGGVSIGSTINPVTTSGSGTLTLNSQNTSGTNTYSGHIGMDRDFTISQSGVGTLNVTSVHTGADTGFVLGTDIKGFTFTLNDIAAANINYSGTIYNSTGTGTLVKTGAGTATLSGTNTFGGPVNLQQGTLSVASVGNTGSTTSNLGSGTTINLGNTNNTAALLYTGTGETSNRVLNLAGTTGSITLDQSGTNLLKFTTDFTATGAGAKTLTLQGSTAGTGEIAGKIVDSTSATSVTKAGTGLWTLSGANTFTGTLTISNGTLAIGTINNASAAGTLGAGSGAVAMGSAGNTGTLEYTGATASSTRNFTSSSASGFAAFQVDNSATNLTLSGNLTGSGSYIKSGAGTLIVNPTGATYSGSLTINGGILAASSGDFFGGSGSAININAGTLRYDATYTGANNTVVLGNSASTIDVSGANSFTPGVVSGSGNLNKAGTGTLTLGSANTFTGKTIIQNGTISASSLNKVSGGTSSSNLGAPVTTGNGTIDFGSATTTGKLVYTGTGETTDRVINLAGTTGGATIDQSGSGTLKFTSDLTATGAGSKTLTLQGSTGGSGEIAGAIVDNSGSNLTSLVKAGSGTWALSGANTYTGTTTISGGTLQVGAGGTTGVLGSGTVTDNAALVFNRSNSLSVANTVGGSGTVTQAGAGTTTLAGGNSYSGGTIVSQGTLVAANNTALGTGSVAVNGATLNAADTITVGNNITVGAAISTTTTNFNSIGGALPTGWGVYTGATASSLGTSTTYTSTPGTTTAWSDTSGAFKNYAATSTGSGSSTATQTAATDRALGIRQTGAFGDPGASFAYNFNTSGLTMSSISLDMMMFTADTRSTTWSIQYGVGASPTSWTTLGTWTDPGAFGSTTLTYNSGLSALDNQANAWFRVVALSAATGSGNRDAMGIDNFVLTLANPGGSVIGSSVVNGTATYSGNITLNGPVSLTAASGGLVTFTGPIADGTGTNNVTKVGTGTVILSGANTYAGTTTISAGTLQLGSGSTTGTLSTSSAIVDNGTFAVNRSNAVTQGTDFSGAAISGTGGFTQAGSGTTTLNAANTFTGTTTVNNGTLNAASNGALGSGTSVGTTAIVVNAGGTLLLSNTSATDRVRNNATITLAGGTFSVDPSSGNITEGTALSVPRAPLPPPPLPPVPPGTLPPVIGGWHITPERGPTSNAAGLGALTLSATSTLDFGSGGFATLVFASFNPGGNTLSILDWTSSATAINSGIDGADDRLVFAADQSGNLNFFDFGGGFTAQQIALGGGFFEIVGLAAVPEPSTWVAGALTLAALLVTQRRKFSRLVGRAARNATERHDRYE